MSEVSYVHNEVIHNTSAAQEVVPIIMELFHPKSVVDVGCGTGTWLSVFNDNGISEFIGIDGDYVDRSKLHIPLDHFMSTDLRAPFLLKKKFDLALSLEVAEHLPEACADSFIDSLTRLSEVILFSAAIPNQGGQNHLNEQWYSYWQEKFAKRGYLFYDHIRPLIWWNRKIEWWYRQNIFLVIKDTHPYSAPKQHPILSAIHPDMHNFYVDNLKNKIEALQKVESEYKRVITGGGSVKESFWVFIRSLRNSASKLFSS